jgi:hypothetical protein
VFVLAYGIPEFRKPSNENLSLKKTKEKYKMNGICCGILERFMYSEFRIPSNVVCAELFKNKITKQ